MLVACLIVAGVPALRMDVGSAVVGGTPASAEAPWAVAVEIDDAAHRCSGSLVTPRHVLTAAHCVAAPFSSWAVRVAGQRLAIATSPAVAPPEVGDVAVLTLPVEVTSVAPVPLAADETFVRSFVRRGVTFFGWGATSVTFTKSTITYGSQATEVRKTPDGAYVGARNCAGYYGPYEACFIKTETFEKDGVAVTKGDSGGPWVGWDGGRWVQLAVESKGNAAKARLHKGHNVGASVAAPVVRSWIFGVLNRPLYHVGYMEYRPHSQPNWASRDPGAAPLPIGTVIELACFVHGERSPYDSDVWYRLGNTAYAGSYIYHYFVQESTPLSITGVPAC